jgi:hypothetical protein
VLTMGKAKIALHQDQWRAKTTLVTVPGSICRSIIIGIRHMTPKLRVLHSLHLSAERVHDGERSDRRPWPSARDRRETEAAG